MNRPRTIAGLLVLAATFFTRGLLAQEDIADVPATEGRIGDDANKRYLLIRRQEPAPQEGYGLVVVLPGGDGSAQFSSFVRRICKFALPEGYLVAEPIAPVWNAKQQVTWPTTKLNVPGMKFTTEEFVAAVIADVAGKEKIDPARIFVLGWSSGGPAAYAVSLANPKVRGAFAAMSVFKPDQLALDGAKGKAFYIYHSQEDRVSPFRMAERAEKDLKKHEGQVLLTTYAGGHGWKGPMYDDIRAGVDWLESNAQPAAEGSEPTPVADARSVTGRVVDENGELVADATLLGIQKTWPGGQYRQDSFRGKSNADGRFSLADLIPAEGQFAIQLAAYRSGYAFASKYQLQKERGPRSLKAMNFRLVKAVPIALVIEDSAGKPAARARVAPASRQAAGGEPQLIYFQGSESIHKVADKAGRVELDCFAPGDQAQLLVQPPGKDWGEYKVRIPTDADTVSIKTR